MDASTLQFNPADPSAWRERVLNSTAPESERLTATTREFESVLLRQYLTEALKPIAQGEGLLGSSSPVYGYLITDALANGLSSSGVFQFSNLLRAQLAGAAGTQDDKDTNTL